MNKNLLLLLIVSTLFYMLTFSSCDNSENIEEQIIQNASYNYEETELVFEHKGNLCENGPWEIYSNRLGEIYAFEWDTEQTGISCIKMIWENEILSYESIDLEEEYLEKFDSGESIDYTALEQEMLFVFSDGLLTVFNEEGSLLNEISLSEKNINIISHYVKENTIYFVSNLISDSDDCYIWEYNWKTGKYISKESLNNIIPKKIIDGYVYGYDGDFIYEIDFSGKVIRKIDKPVSSNSVSELFNKELLTAYAGGIYYINETGIYLANQNQEDFKLLMGSDDSKYISGEYTLVDVNVVSQDEIYIVAIKGPDEEWPTDISVYRKIN